MSVAIDISGHIAQELRRFGSRTARHLTDLTSRVVEDEIDLDLTWRTPAGQLHRAVLQRRSAETIQAAIKINEVEVREVEVTGILTTVSMTATFLPIEQMTDACTDSLAACAGGTFVT